MSGPVGYLDICTDCTWNSLMEGRTLGQRLAESLDEALEESELADSISLRPAPCLGLCRERCRASISGPQRWSWVLGDLWPDDDHHDLLTFLRLWCRAPDGFVPETDRPSALRKRLLANIPPSTEAR